MALSRVNVDSRTKRLLLLRVHDMTQSNSLSMYALASLPQAEIIDSRHLNMTTKAISMITIFVTMYYNHESKKTRHSTLSHRDVMVLKPKPKTMVLR